MNFRMQRAWLMVAVSTVMAAMGFGVLFTMAVFLTPLAVEFGWPRADVSLAYAVVTIATGLEPVGSTPGELAARMKVDYEKWSGLIRRIGLKIE